MASKTFRFPTDPVVEYGAPLVFWRTRWADAWVPEPVAIGVESVWCLPPAMPTAALVHRYGVRQFGGVPAWVNVDKDTTLAGKFVKLSWPMDRKTNKGKPTNEWNYRHWFGVVDLVEDDLGGVDFRATRTGAATTTTAVAMGQQVMACYGLEKLLSDRPIRSSWVDNAAAATEVATALAFNRGGKPNRSAAKIGSTHVFSHDLATAQWWSTRDIVEYLLARQVPRDKTGAIKVPFVMAGLGLPDWDKPEVVQEGASLLSLLAQLVNRSQMLSWRLTVDETATPDAVRFEVLSLAETDITLPLTGSPKIPASSRQKELVFDRDPLTTAQLKTSGAGKYHRVRVTGARKRSVGSFAFGDGSLRAGWDSLLETEYNAGASGAADYAALDDEEKRTRDAAARGDPRFEEVFALFTVPEGWDQKVKDGAGGAANPLFLDFAATPAAAFVFLGDSCVTPTLPLYQGLNYAGTNIADGAVAVTDFSKAINLEEMPPLVFFQRPDQPGKWAAGDKLATGGELPRAYGTAGGNSRLSVSVQVPNDSRGVLLRVQGDFQHAIAPSEFVPLPVDVLLGGLDWRFAVVTWAMEWDRVEGIWPPDDDLPAAVDCIREKILHAGDRYRADYVAPGTVVGVDAGGALKRSTGGWLPKLADDDDRARLEAMAKLAFAWWGVDHYVLTLDTVRPIAAEDLDVGDLITEIGEPAATGGHRVTINATVSQVRLTWPEADGTRPPAPRLEFTTDGGELDPMQPESGVGPRDPVTTELPASRLVMDPTTAFA